MNHETITTETTPEVTLPPSLEQNLFAYQQYIENLELLAKAGSSEYYPFSNMFPLIKQLKSDEIDPRKISDYFVLFNKEMELKEKMKGKGPFECDAATNLLIYRLGADLVGKAFSAEPENGPLHIALSEALQKTVEIKGFIAALDGILEALQIGYKRRSITQLLGIGGDEYKNKLRTLLRNERIINKIRFKEQGKKFDYNNYNRSEDQKATWEWMTKAVEAVSGLSAAEASEFTFSASRHLLPDKDTIRILQAFDHFGVDRIRELAEKTGIRGLEAYNIEQLELMEQFIHNPSELAEELTNHDVTVVFTNRSGDHNGVFHDIASDFDDNRKRTLFFEIEKMSDIYRYMATLKKAGIKPSTLVLAAHSGPGRFVVSNLYKNNQSFGHNEYIASINGRALIDMANKNDRTEPETGDYTYSYSIQDMKGMTRLVDDYMQPSRAIDDNEADKDRKKIIFAACYAAKPTEVMDLDQNNEINQISTESVISQLGNTIAKSGKSNVDIYGGPDALRLRSNSDGVYYTRSATPEEALSSGSNIVLLPAVRLRVDGGHLREEEVNNIPLHNK